MNLKEISKFIKLLKSGNTDGITTMFRGMSEWQQKAIIGSGVLDESLQNALRTQMAATSATNAQKAATTGLSTAFTGLGASIKAAFSAMLTNPITYIAIAGAALFAYADYVSKAQERASSAANESANAYQETTSEVQSLNSELETTINRIAELQGMDSLTLAEENELQKLQQENEQLERQISIKEKLAQAQSLQAAADAREAVDTESKQVYNIAYDENGNPTDTSASGVSVNRAVYIKSKLAEMEKLKNKIKETEDYLADPSNDADSKEFKRQAKLLETQKETMQEYEKEVGQVVSELSKDAEGFYDANGNIVKGYEEDAKAVEEVIDAYNDRDLSDGEKKLKKVQKYFDGSSRKNRLKDKLLDVAKAGGKAEDIVDTLESLGISLEDAGLDADTLVRYFQEMADAANETASATKEIDNNLGLDEVSKAFESKNPGDDYVSLNDYLGKAKKLYDQGLIGTDDFKSVAEYISYGKDSTDTSFLTNYNKLQRYFTPDSEGNLTAQGVHNFLLDLKQCGIERDKVYAEFENGKWNLNMDNTAQAAKDMGLSVQVFEDMLGRLQDYDNVGEFQFVSAIKEFDEAKTSLEGLKSVYDDLEDGDYKDALKLKLDEWSPMIDAAENDLASLPQEVVTKLRFEYDLAEIRQQLDEANRQWEGGKRNTDTGYDRILLSEEYVTKREEETGYTKDKDADYAQSYKAVEELKSRFTNDMSESDKLDLQDSIYGIQEMQMAFQDLIESGESIDWASYLKTDEAQKAMNDIVRDTGMSMSELESLLGTDIKQFGLNFDDSELQSLLSTVKELKNGESITVEAEVEGNGLQEIQAIKDENGKITYQVEIDGEVQELQLLPTEDGSVVFGIKVEDEATPVIDEITQREVEAKIVEVVGEDNASYVIDYWNQKLQVEPKLATLSAEDQATWVINEWNAMSPVAKQGFMDGTITLTDNTAEGTESAKGNLESVPKTTDTSINTTSNTATQVSLAKSYLDGINGKTVNTYIVTHKSTVNDLAGTAHLSGTAYAGGTVGDNSWLKSSWKTKKDEVALTGEEGMELVATRNDGWYTIGEEGAEFNAIPAGSVIFNARQTKELLSKGRIRGRGRNHLSGTAYLGSSSGGFAFGGGASIYNTGSTVNSKSNNTNTSQANEEAEEFKETLDWIERKLKAVERDIDNLDKTASAAYKSWSERNTALSSEIAKVNEEISIQQQAYQRYIQQAESVGLSDSYKQLIQAGKIDIETITDEDLKEKIDEYQDWYDKALDCQDAVQDLQDNLADLAKTRFDGVVTQFENLLSVIEHTIDLTETSIDKIETEGYLVSVSMYKAQKELQESQLSTLHEELSSLQSALTTAMAEGNIAKYSEDWYELTGNIQDVEAEIAGLNKDLIETNNLIRETPWNLFDKMQEMLGSVQEESDWLIDLMSDDKMFDSDTAAITDKGQATLGLHAVNFNAYMSQADDYAKEIQKINEDIAKDPYNTILLDRRKELIEAQRDLITSAQDEKQAIKDLVSDGYDAFLDVLNKIIDKRTELLESTKDLYDYQKSIESQVKSISELEKQLNAYTGDDSESAKKTVQELKVSLEQAKDDLAESEYDQYISDQQKMLESMRSEIEEWINGRLDNIDGLIQGVIDSTNANSESIKTTLEQQASSVGTTLSNSMSEIWSKDGDIANVVTTYGSSFNTALTTTNSVLESIRGYLQAMVSASDKKAETEKKNNTSVTTKQDTPKVETPKKDTTPTQPKKEITVGGKINAGSARIYATSSGTGGGTQYYANDPVYTVLGEQNGYVLARYHKLNSGHTGWFKKSDVKAYKDGGLIDYTGLAWVDGTKSKPEAVLNADDTENLVKMTGIISKIGDVDIMKFQSSLDVLPQVQSFTSAQLPKIEPYQVEQVVNIDLGGIEMNGVNDPQEFAEQLRYTLKNDLRTQKIIQADTLGVMLGHNSLTKFKY